MIVIRVSTGSQAKNGTRLDTQLESCRLKAIELNIPIIGEYEDAGKSGALLKYRSGMMKAIADIEEGRADTVQALLAASEKPEAIAAAVAAYRLDQPDNAEAKICRIGAASCLSCWPACRGQSRRARGSGWRT